MTMTDEEILEMGFMLEDKGLSHSEIDDILVHHGVKGQKWGVITGSKRQNRLQRHVDRLDKIVKGTATSRDKTLSKRVSGRSIIDPEVAKTNLSALQDLQNKTNRGKAKVRDILLRVQGINVKKLNLHQN